MTTQWHEEYHEHREQCDKAEENIGKLAYAVGDMLERHYDEHHDDDKREAGCTCAAYQEHRQLLISMGIEA